MGIVGLSIYDFFFFFFNTYYSQQHVIRFLSLFLPRLKLTNRNKLVFLVHFLLISIGHGFINEVVLLLFFSFIKKEEKRISHKRGCTFQAKFLILN